MEIGFTTTSTSSQTLLPTFIGERVSVPEVDEGGEGLDAVALGQLWVLQLHHLDAVQVAVVI